MLEIKRKYKKLPNNRIRWWHILTGNEDELGFPGEKMGGGERLGGKLMSMKLF